MLKYVIDLLKKMLCNVLHRTEYYGLENIAKDKLYIFAANHVSSMDPALVMNKVDNLVIMAKEELFKIPVVRTFVKASGGFPIARGKKDVKAILHAAKAITEFKHNLLIFPEGTRKAKNKGVKAKNGAVCIAQIAKVDIIPVYLSEERGMFKKYIVKFGKPINISNENESEKTDKQQLRDLLTKKVMDNIYNMRG